MTSSGTAIIGTGFMGWVHLEALRRIGVPVVGVLGSGQQKSEDFAACLGVPRAYASFDEVLADDNVTTVHINTPNRTHFEMAKAALEAGRHVLCEKPLAMTSAESAALVQIADRHPRQAAAVNYNIRFYPMCMEARERIRRGDSGRLFNVTGSYVQDWLLHDTDYNWRVLAEAGGELRAVADIGTHWLDLVQFITGLKIESVCADLQTVHPVRRRPKGEVQTFSSGSAGETEPVGISTDDYGCVMLRFAGGAHGVLHVSQVTAGRKNCLRFEISAQQQALAWNSEQLNELWIGHRDRANEVLPRDPSLLTDAAKACASYPGGHNEGYDDSFKQCFRSFYNYIEAADFSADPPFATFRDGHREIVLCEAILQSHRERKWVEA
ncbi:MAG: Gfo/Idh/MocA family oxidoreductase [Planctomycetaceae bacterium]